MLDLISIQNSLKELSDGQLQMELMHGSGAVPSYMVLSELKRRADMRNSSMQAQQPQGSMMQQYAGLGAARQAGQPQMQQPEMYSRPGNATTAGSAIMGNPMGTRGFADGGSIDLPADFYDVNGLNDSPWFPSRQRFFNSMGRPDITPTPITPSSQPNFGNLIPDVELPQALKGSVGQSIQDYGKVGTLRPGIAAFLQNAFTPRDVGQMIAGNPNIPENVPPPAVTSADFVSQGDGLNAALPADSPFNVPDVTSSDFSGAAGDNPVAVAAQRKLDVSKLGSQAPRGTGAPTARGTIGGGGGSPGAGTGVMSLRGGIPNDPQGLSDFIGQVRDMQLPDRFGALEAQNAQDKQTLADNAKRDKGLAMLQAGLGMLAGTSPFAAVNIGRGGMMGLQYLRQANRDQQQAAQGLRASDQQIAIAEANRDQKALDNAINTKMHYDEMMQRSADRQASLGSAAASRAQALQLKEMDLADRQKDRALQRQLTMAKGYDDEYRTNISQANMIDTKIAALQANPLSGSDPALKAQLDALRTQSKALNDRARQAALGKRDVMVRIGIKTGDIRQPKSEAEIKSYPSGTRWLDPGGVVNIVP